MINRTLILVTFLLIITNVIAQSDFEMNESIFREKVRNKSWSMEDTTKKKDYELFLLAFNEDTLVSAYLDITESLNASSCLYKVSFHSNIFELTLDDCSSSSDKFIYGYFSENGILEILFSEYYMEIDKLKDENLNWFSFTELTED
jgi:hypothetical protein